MVMLSKPPYPSCNQFVLSLKSHEQSLQMVAEINGNQTNHDQAFYSRHGRGCGNGGRFNSSGRGFGPTANKNQQDYKGKSEGNWLTNSSHKTDDTIVCQIFGKQNHTTIKFWSIFDHSVQPKEELPQALAALNINWEHDPTLYAYSGATTHIMNHTD